MSFENHLRETIFIFIFLVTVDRSTVLHVRMQLFYCFLNRRVSNIAGFYMIALYVLLKHYKTFFTTRHVWAVFIFDDEKQGFCEILHFWVREHRLSAWKIRVVFWNWNRNNNYAISGYLVSNRKHGFVYVYSTNLAYLDVLQNCQLSQLRN